MTVAEFAGLIVACLAGGAVAWFVAYGRGYAVGAAQARDIEARAAAGEARAQELRTQVAAAQTELTSLRHEWSVSEQARVAADTRAAEIARHADEQRRLLDEARVRLGETFKAIAADALQGNAASFLQLADEKFKALREEAAGDLDARRQAITTLLNPLTQTLDTYQRETRELEQRRDRELGTVGEQLRHVATAQLQLQSETARLVNALRAPHVRGRWGEIALRRTAELAGMSAYCDFTEQDQLPSENGSLRPDMIVHLPAGREVIVDSKVPLAGYLDALEAADESARLAALSRHARHVREHVQRLASKNYPRELAASAEFVVLFIPNDSFLAAAAEHDADLVEWALAQQVVLATPATFIALLRAIAHGWRQAKVAENAQRISEVGRELSERMAVLVEHLSSIGGAIGRAVESYNKAVGSLESRVLPTARKLDSLDLGTKRDMPELEPIEQAVRQLAPSRLELEPPEPEPERPAKAAAAGFSLPFEPRERGAGGAGRG
jgi:DNA recombination protein RmuC